MAARKDGCKVVNIAFIGIGAMGTPMALTLARTGNAVFTYDRNPQRLANVEIHAETTTCSDLATAVSETQLAITMTPNDDALLETVHAVVNAPRRTVKIFVDTSSTSLDATREADSVLRAAGITFLDAAVYGLGVQGAKDRCSPIVISGPREAYDEIARTIAPLGTVDYVGELGRAKIIKILNNQLVGAFCVAAAEIVSIGVAGGIPLPKIIESLTAGSGSSFILEKYYPSYLRSGSFGLGLIPITYMIKDLRLACELAQEVHSSAALTELSRQIYQAAECELGDVPFPEVYLFYNKLNGIEREAVTA